MVASSCTWDLRHVVCGPAGLRVWGLGSGSLDLWVCVVVRQPRLLGGCLFTSLGADPSCRHAQRRKDRLVTSTSPAHTIGYRRTPRQYHYRGKLLNCVGGGSLNGIGGFGSLNGIGGFTCSTVVLRLFYGCSTDVLVGSTCPAVAIVTVIYALLIGSVRVPLDCLIVGAGLPPPPPDSFRLFFILNKKIRERLTTGTRCTFLFLCYGCVPRAGR